MNKDQENLLQEHMDGMRGELIEDIDELISMLNEVKVERAAIDWEKFSELLGKVPLHIGIIGGLEASIDALKALEKQKKEVI